MKLYLYGIINDGKEMDFGEIGFANSHGKRTLVKTFPLDDIAIVMSELDEWAVDENDKQDLMQKLLSHQKTLEEIMKQRLVIPIKFGTSVESLEDTMTIIKRGQPLFKKALADMEGKFEVNLTASWDVLREIKKIAEGDDEIKALKLKAQEEKSRELIMEVGMELEDKLETERQRVAAEILFSLNKWGKNRVDHERLENKMILNTSFLISKSREDDFLKSIYGLDDKFNSEFDFKCLMPLPPHSFRTVQVQKVESGCLREAMNLFKVDRDTTLDMLKERGRELIQLHHPDSKEKEDRNEKISQIYQSLDLLKAFYDVEENPFANLDVECCYLTKVVEGTA
ncbi:MAG: GvpL/GvpF family gas vesicle protein [Pseudomonadota bacterium]